MSFKMKMKPVKPTRKSHYHEIEINKGTTVDVVLNEIKKSGLNPKEAEFTIDCYEIIIEYKTLECEEYYKQRLDRWKEELKEYILWCNENKVAIQNIKTFSRRKKEIEKDYKKKLDDLEREFKK